MQIISSKNRYRMTWNRKNVSVTLQTNQIMHMQKATLFF